MPIVLLSALDAATWVISQEARFTVHVTDDFGNNVTGIVVSASTLEKYMPGENFGTDKNRSMSLATGTNGLAAFSLPCVSGKIAFGTKHDSPGFYWDRGHEIKFKKENGNWQPSNPIVELKIKKILNPIPLYTKQVGLFSPHVKIPEFGKPIGFDLLKADWVAPYGKGKYSDFIFTLNTKLGQTTKNGYQIHDSSFHVNFSNEGDGILSAYADPYKGSVLRLSRSAPEHGYETSMMRRAYSHEKEAFNEYREDQNYFFRVRTKKDDEGNIVSALYGKIHGEIGWLGAIKFTYYLNPTPNDRNLEFDGKNNLFKPDWQDTAWPSEP